MTMKRITLFAGLVLSVAAMAEPGGRPPGPPAPPSGRESGGRGPSGWHRPGEEPVSAEEVDAFMKETSPKRYEAMQKLSPEQQKKIRERAEMLYRMLKWGSKNEPAMWEAKKQEIGLEDDLFALRMQLLRKDAPDAAEQKEIRDTMRAKVRKLVDMRLKERAERIEKLRKFLGDEEARLTQDQKNVDELVDTRLKEEIEAGSEFGRPPERRWPQRDREKDKEGKGREEK